MVQVTLAPDRASNSGEGWKPSGEAMRNSNPILAAAKNPGQADIASAIAHKGDHLVLDGPPLLFKGEDIGQNLARMFIVRQRINCGDS